MMEERSALDIVSEYAAAMAASDAERMDRLCSQEFMLDFVHFDAPGVDPFSAEDTRKFWSTWFTAFPDDYDLEITRTIAAEEVVVMQWIFTGTNTGPLELPISLPRAEPTGRTVRLRGVSVFDISGGLIQRETIYLDIATLLVELGVGL